MGRRANYLWKKGSFCNKTGLACIFLGYYFKLNNHLFRAFFLFYIKNRGESRLSPPSFGNIPWEWGWKNKSTWLNIKRIKNLKFSDLKDFAHNFQIYFIRKPSSYIWGSQGWAASQAVFRFFSHKFKKVISANNMFIRPLFSIKLSSDCLQCFIKVALKIISVAWYLSIVVGVWNSS